jgi:hypothetical protein
MRTLLLPSVLALVSLGCAQAQVDIPLDLDGDGLLSDLEEQLGTDPDDDDSDGDGWTDGEEYDQNTDPLDSNSKPYHGGWKIDACHDSVQATGNQVGDVIENLQAVDQFGDTVEFHDFCNKVVALIGATET